jgi:hypothetical protein
VEKVDRERGKQSFFMTWSQTKFGVCKFEYQPT